MYSSISKKDTASEFNESDFSIIVIEDDEGLNHLISKKLKKEGYLVHSALNGKEALAKVTGSKHEVLLLDFKLPDYTGKQLIEKLMVQHGNALNFIMMTGFGDEKIAVDIMKLGAKDYIIKEANFLDIFVEKVRKICNEVLNENKLRELENDLKKMLSSLMKLQKLP